MHISLSDGLRPYGNTGAALALLLLCASCAPFRGYPVNPDDTDANLTSLEAGAASEKVKYLQASDPDTARTQRNRVVYTKMQVYEIYFTNFQQRLWGDNNFFSVGGDMAALILNGLGATTGSTTTKAALSAASGGIIGAKAAIDKDIYFQQTLPAVLAQMSANRDKIKSAIIDNLKQSDAAYPLAAAEIDLQVLERASSIPDAIQSITRVTTLNKALAAQAVEESRTGTFSKTDSAKQIRAWLNFGIDASGKPLKLNSANYTRLQKWVDINFPGLPVAQLLTDNSKSQALEAARQQAILDLQIPGISA